jgi:hypothetical protein
VTREEAVAILESRDRYVGDMPLAEIPSLLWTLKGIHFESSSAQDGKQHYCHIVVRTDDLFAAFPGEREELAVERIGGTLLLNEANSPKSRLPSLRGRPSYPWERFHLEVSALLQKMSFQQRKSRLSAPRLRMAHRNRSNGHSEEDEPTFTDAMHRSCRQ